MRILIASFLFVCLSGASNDTGKARKSDINLAQYFLFSELKLCSLLLFAELSTRKVKRCRKDTSVAETRRCYSRPCWIDNNNVRAVWTAY